MSNIPKLRELRGILSRDKHKYLVTRRFLCSVTIYAESKEKAEEIAKTLSPEDYDTVSYKEGYRVKLERRK